MKKKFNIGKVDIELGLIIGIAIGLNKHWSGSDLAIVLPGIVIMYEFKKKQKKNKYYGEY